MLRQLLERCQRAVPVNLRVKCELGQSDIYGHFHPWGSLRNTPTNGERSLESRELAWGTETGSRLGLLDTRTRQQLWETLWASVPGLLRMETTARECRFHQNCKKKKNSLSTKPQVSEPIRMLRSKGNWVNWTPKGDKCLCREEGHMHFHLWPSVGERGLLFSQGEENNGDFSKFCVEECGSSGPPDPYKGSLAPTCQLFSTGFHWMLVRRSGWPRPREGPPVHRPVEVWRESKGYLKNKMCWPLGLWVFASEGQCLGQRGLP